MKTRNLRGWLGVGVAAIALAVWALPCGSMPLYAQAKRDKEAGEKEEGKGLTLKEARRLATENNYDVQLAKKQLVEKKITRAQYDARVARLIADVDRAYMNLYVARLQLQAARQQAARGASIKMSGRKGGPKIPVSAEASPEDRVFAQSRELAAFIPLEYQVKTQDLNLKALLNAKAYSLRSDAEVVPADRPVAIKKELDVDALIEKALDYADRQSGGPVVRGRGARSDRPPTDFDNQKKQIILEVRQAILKAEASVKKLEIARQVKEIQQKRLDALRAAKADPAEITAAEDAVQDAAVDELQAIVANNSDLLKVSERTGTLQKDLDLEAED